MTGLEGESKALVTSARPPAAGRGMGIRGHGDFGVGRAPLGNAAPEWGPGAGTRKGWGMGTQAGLSPCPHVRLSTAAQQENGGSKPGLGIVHPTAPQHSPVPGVPDSLHPHPQPRTSAASIAHSQTQQSRILSPMSLQPCVSASCCHILLPVVPHPAAPSTHILLPVFPHPASYSCVSRILQPCIPISCILTAVYPTALYSASRSPISLCFAYRQLCILTSHNPQPHIPTSSSIISHSPVALHPTVLDFKALNPYIPHPCIHASVHSISLQLTSRSSLTLQTTALYLTAPDLHTPQHPILVTQLLHHRVLTSCIL